MNTALPFAETSQQPSEFKKLVVGIVYKFAIEIIFFIAAAIGIGVLWYLVFHCSGLSDHQKGYVYHPYELKYITIIIGGVKRRVAVKKFYKRRILGE